MKGKLILFEGLDCSGKTTLIKEILNELNNPKFIYVKGMGSNTKIGNFSRKFPSTLMFFIELLCLTITQIKPSLKKGKIVFQDRGNISISSYVPKTKKTFNRIIISLFNRFLIKPDILIYLHVPIEKRIERLKQKGTKYEVILANNPELILDREKEYIRLYNQSKSEKAVINSSGSIEETTKLIKDFLKNSLSLSQLNIFFT